MKSKMLLSLNQTNRRLRAEAFENYLKVLRLLCEDYKHVPFTARLGGLLRARQFDAVLALADSLSEQSYSDATEHFVANQFALLIKKYPWPEGSVHTDPEGRALKKFLHSEHVCGRVNKRFRCFEKRSPYESSLSTMRGFIAHVLGHEVPLSTIWSGCEFGPGASIGVHGNATNKGRKIASSWTVTPSANHYVAAGVVSNAQLLEFFSESRGTMYCVDPVSTFKKLTTDATYVNHNKIVFVPKTAKVHRTIAIEPVGNGFVQKGVDVFMRSRLKRIGINLQDQSLNQRMAREGSLDDSQEGSVTIDLSSASDSISIGLVKNLLPPEWFEFLNSIRSKSGLVNGELIAYRKFCSMGNGFCFPLETLLFTAACVATKCGRPGIDFSVYGDDIIVRKERSADLIALLKVMGFSVNKEKTFLQGPFRESCGADWFGGADVRPYTFDNALDSVQNVFKFLNLSSRKANLSAFFSGVRPFLIGLLPSTLHLLRPYQGNVDSGIDAPIDQFMASPYAKWNKPHQCWEWSELSVAACPDEGMWLHDKYHSILVYGALSGSSSDKPFTVRRKTKTKVRRIAHSDASATLASVRLE